MRPRADGAVPALRPGFLAKGMAGWYTARASEGPGHDPQALHFSAGGPA